MRKLGGAGSSVCCIEQGLCGPAQEVVVCGVRSTTSAWCTIYDRPPMMCRVWVRFQSAGTDIKMHLIVLCFLAV